MPTGGIFFLGVLNACHTSLRSMISLCWVESYWSYISASIFLTLWALRIRSRLSSIFARTKCTPCRQGKHNRVQC